MRHDRRPRQAQALRVARTLVLAPIKSRSMVVVPHPTVVVPMGVVLHGRVRAPHA